jgi:tRNA(His) 5'-end guanylyltransferase
MRQDFNSLGDRMKSYEAINDVRCLPNIPTIARMDGRAFHTFTRGLNNPFDDRLGECFRETSKQVLKEFCADIVYTQSDEITLVWKDGITSFNGRLQKLVSNLASYTTIAFYKNLLEYLPSKAPTFPVFDARVFSVPSLEEAANCLLWREMDATKNSVYSLAYANFSHTELLHKTTKQKIKMLEDRGIFWCNYPDYLKKGSYFKYTTVLKTFEQDELDKLPELHHARQNPELKIRRRFIQELIIFPLSKITNKVGVLFE